METTTTPGAKFIVGQTYVCRSVCDFNCVWSYKCVSRTAKTAKFFFAASGVVTCKIKLFDGNETVFPQGRYSMAPILRA